MFKKFRYLLDYFKLLKNPFSSLLFKFGIKKTLNVKFRYSDKIIKLNKRSVLDNLMSMLPYQKDVPDEFENFIVDLNSSKKIISWAGVKIFNYTEVDLSNAHVVFFEYFNRGYWSDFPIYFNNKVVIDIGSHIGDSALYFAGQGAEVYAFEPVKYLFEYSLKLSDLNSNIKNNIHIFNKGVSDKPGMLAINSMDSTSSYLKENDSYNVEIISLNEILDNLNIKPDVLKMDCEGCEFNIILNQDISVFNDIIFEHHSKIVGKDYKLLIDKLVSYGFNIKQIEYGGSEFKDMGLIHAYK